MSRSVPAPKKVISVYLDSNGYDEEVYYCPRCRSPLIEYEGNIIQEIPGHTPYKPYTVLKCRGSRQRKDGVWEECGRHYVFAGVILTKNPEMS